MVSPVASATIVSPTTNRLQMIGEIQAMASTSLVSGARLNATARLRGGTLQARSAASPITTPWPVPGGMGLPSASTTTAACAGADNISAATNVAQVACLCVELAISDRR